MGTYPLADLDDPGLIEPRSERAPAGKCRQNAGGSQGIAAKIFCIMLNMPES